MAELPGWMEHYEVYRALVNRVRDAEDRLTHMWKAFKEMEARALRAEAERDELKGAENG